MNQSVTSYRSDHKPFDEWRDQPVDLMTELKRWEYTPEQVKIFREIESLICPCALLFYRPNKPVIRKGTKRQMEQNNNSYCLVEINTINGFNGIKRVMKHRGFSKLIALLPVSKYYDDQALSAQTRYAFFKYKTVRELMIRHGLTEDECERISQMFPTKASGQLSIYL